MTFIVLYLATMATVQVVAPWYGRVALPCWATDNEPLGAATPITCALNRNYARPSAVATLVELSRYMAKKHSGTIVHYLDASFPFIDGFPILPHLSHRRGTSVDLEFPGNQSPIGYWLYVQPRPGDAMPCLNMPSWLRWDFDFWQSWFGDARLDDVDTRDMIMWLARSSSVRRMLLEQHLQDRLGFVSEKVRFQGCNAARHDDHLHVDFH